MADLSEVNGSLLEISNEMRTIRQTLEEIVREQGERDYVHSLREILFDTVVLQAFFNGGHFRSHLLEDSDPNGQRWAEFYAQAENMVNTGVRVPPAEEDLVVLTDPPHARPMTIMEQTFLERIQNVESHITMLEAIISQLNTRLTQLEQRE